MDPALAGIVEEIAEADRPWFLALYETQRRDPQTALLLSILLGWLGVDRFYLQEWDLGLLKFFTGAAMGLWWVADWFLIQAAAEKANRKIALKVRLLMPSYHPRVQ